MFQYSGNDFESPGTRVEEKLKEDIADLERDGSRFAGVVFLCPSMCAAMGSYEIGTTNQNGMMNMEHLSEITVEPGTTLMLEPGGMHLMMHPLKPTTAGETITVELEMSDGTQQTLLFSVRP